MDHKQQNIVQAILDTATSVMLETKELPNTSKRRNIFRKQYNRRPMNKQKRAKAVSLMVLSGVLGSVQIAKILSQPIPKYDKA